MNNIINNILKYALIMISAMTLWSGIIYKVYSLNYIGVVATLLLAGTTSIAIIVRFGQKKEKDSCIERIAETLFEQKKMKLRDVHVILPTFYILLATHAFFILWTSRTTEAIISPWQTVPHLFFFIYALATLILFLIILNNSNKTFQILALIHFFLSFSVAIIVYKIGYGYDSFIHEAALDLINKTGSVDPKPFYYLGYYGLIITIHKITLLPIIWISKLLVPLLAGIYIPLLSFSFIKKTFNNEIAGNLAILALLFLPFGFFILSTPQSFAYLFLVLVIIFGLIAESAFDLIVIFLLSLAALLVQPIAGIPAVLFSTALAIRHNDIEYKKYFYALVFLSSIFAIPLAFYLFGDKTNATDSAMISVRFNDLFHEFVQWFKPVNPNQENFLLNLIYLYSFNIKILIAAIVAAGAWVAIKHKNNCQNFFLYLNMSAALFLSYIFAKLLPFDFLIYYERSNYADRILFMACFFLFPFIFIAIFAFFDALNKKNNIIKYSFIIFFALLITNSLYISYPRLDNYFNSHGFSVGQYDIEAVQWINKNANSKNYIVLSNQQVAAAALREFGFNKYYKVNDTEIFYYPIPTGGQLYQYYLDMVYKQPSRTTINVAMSLVNAEQAYFVLNKYWWASPKIKEEAKIEADSWEEFGDGEVVVFKYGK
ncbi:MAG: hypothetical protein ABH881_04270 [bacterium]